MSNDSSSKFEVCFTIYVTKDGLYVNGGLHIDQQSILKIPLELSQNNKIHIEVEFKGVNKSGVAFLKFIRYSTLLTYTNCPQYVLSALQNAMQYVITVDDADILNEQLEFELIDRKRSVVHLINEDVSTASNHNDVHQFRYIDIFNKKALSFLFGAIAVILVFVVIGGCLYAIKSHFKTVEAENQKYAKDVELQRLARDKQIEETWHRKTLIDSLVECKYNSSKDYLNSYFRDSSKLDRYQLAASLNKAALTKGFVNKEFVDFYINRISSLADYSCSTGSKSDSAICYAKFANSLIGAHPAIEHQARLMYNRKVNICLAKDSLNAQCGYLKMDYFPFQL
ncbi:MAG: hypothetical protein IPP69_16745 [Flavobacteriales bacterium]|nr:hypothetical protein [Flavobacteriales bacterium]